MTKTQTLNRRGAIVTALATAAAFVFPFTVVRVAQERDTIPQLFRRWLKLLNASTTGMSDAEADALFEEYARVRRRLTAMRPANVREAAMQFVAETDDGQSEYRDAFYRRLRRLAVEG